MSIRVCYSFTVNSAMEKAFLSFYRHILVPHLSQCPGFLGEVLLQDALQCEQYTIIGCWENKQYFEIWRAAPDHQAIVCDLPKFLASRPQIQLYEALSPGKESC